MIVDRRPIAARGARRIGIVDEIVEGDLLAGAHRLRRKARRREAPADARARSRRAARARPRRPGAFDAARERRDEARARQPRAAERCVEAVRRGRRCRSTRDWRSSASSSCELVTSHGVGGAAPRLLRRARGREDPGRAGRHAAARRSRSGGVIGAGTMGGGIAMSFANAGIPVTLVETSAGSARLAASRRSARTTQRPWRKGGSRQEDDGRAHGAASRHDSTSTRSPTPTSSSRRCSRTWTSSRNVRASSTRRKPGAILATNTSTLDVDEIAAAHERPAGRHRHCTSSARRTSCGWSKSCAARRPRRDVLATAMELGRSDRQGAGAGRRLRRLRRQPHARAVLARGGVPARGRRPAATGRRGARPSSASHGPVRDERHGRPRHRLAPESPCREAAARERALGDRRRARRDGPLRAEDGRRLLPLRGRRRTPLPDPEVEEIIVAGLEAAGIERRTIDDEEIVERMLYALINEGAKILEEGIAQRPATSTSSGSTATVFRPGAAGRCSLPTRSA